MLPKPPKSTHNDIQGYLSRSSPFQLVNFKLWQKTLLQILSLGECLPCPFLVGALLEEVRPTSNGTLEQLGWTYPEAIKRTIQERRYTDPLFDKALQWIANLPHGSIPDNLSYILNRLGGNLPLPQMEISPGEIRQIHQNQQLLETGPLWAGPKDENTWPPWGSQTLEALVTPRFALESNDLALLESGGVHWSASERKWFAEVLESRLWFLRWRKAPPLPRILGNSLVWESRQDHENQQEGGLETLVPKGPLENLLPSELIWIGESTNLFSWKWNQGELLYFGREHSTALRPSLCWKLVWDPKALDWHYWPQGCPGRMGAMALGWILSVLEAVHRARGPWDIDTRWILLEKPGADWEQVVKPLRHIVKSLWPHQSQWGKHPNIPRQLGARANHTHQCSIRFGCETTQSTSIQLHPQSNSEEEIPLNLTLVGTPQSPEDWLEWDERVMRDLGRFWIPTGETHVSE